ncbi:MAG: type II secretion system F family protein, partial [Pirellulaceae bacterium]
MATHHEESWEWSQQILGAAQAGHSLAEGFRAAAEETRAPRVAAAMRQLADQLEQGVPLDRALTESSVALPTHVQALVRSAARTGQFSTAFGDLVEHERAVRDLKASILDGLAYSLVVTAISAVLILVILFVSGSAFGKLFEDFQISLPLTTRLFFWYRDVGVWLLAGLVILAVIGSWVFRRTQGEVAWADLVATIPVIGHLSLSFGLAEAASLLAVLTRQNIPVPEALELCASGVRHASVRAMTQRWAVATAGGQSLAQA